MHDRNNHIEGSAAAVTPQQSAVEKSIPSHIYSTLSKTARVDAVQAQMTNGDDVSLSLHKILQSGVDLAELPRHDVAIHEPSHALFPGHDGNDDSTSVDSHESSATTHSKIPQTHGNLQFPGHDSAHSVDSTGTATTTASGDRYNNDTSFASDFSSNPPSSSDHEDDHTHTVPSMPSRRGRTVSYDAISVGSGFSSDQTFSSGFDDEGGSAISSVLSREDRADTLGDEPHATFPDHRDDRA